MCDGDVSCNTCETGACNKGILSSMTDGQLLLLKRHMESAARDSGVELIVQNTEENGDTMSEEVTINETEQVEAPVEATEETVANSEVAEPVVEASEETVEAPTEATEEVVEATEAPAEEVVEAEAEPEAVEATEEVAEETVEETVEAPAEVSNVTNVVVEGVPQEVYDAKVAELTEMADELEALKAGQEQVMVTLSEMKKQMLEMVPQEQLTAANLKAASSFVPGFEAETPLAEQDAGVVAKVIAFTRTVTGLATSANAGAVETDKARAKKKNDEPRLTFPGLSLPDEFRRKKE